MLVLGIESTCDETACSVVEDGKVILTTVIASQAAYHEQYRGVFPEMASREHEAVIIQTIESALNGMRIDLIAVSQGPGLMGALVLGLSAAKALSLAWSVPYVGVNHVEAHIYAAMMSSSQFDLFPSLGIVLSGGHTFMLRMDGIGKYNLISTTVDDSIGEAFDKVASMLDLPYPGGPAIEALAKKGSPNLPFRAGQVKTNPLAFSFSGLKTRVLYSLDEKKEDIAASFQHAAFTDILKKAKKATATFDCQAIFLGGGVSCNQALRDMFTLPIPVYWPDLPLCADNGAMIAGLGYHKFLERGSDPLTLEAFPRFINKKTATVGSDLSS
jgi:N6-L-threonylcarbamoyladenine synthase